MPAASEVSNQHEIVIGLEVHVQLLTKTKIFCGCSTRFGDPANTHTCPVCLGLPGALPVLNRDAVTMALKAAMALNCAINPQSRFARKNYFYPDLPKGYQISQYDEPLAEHGWMEIGAEGRSKRIGITRVHLEEDAGKSLHEGFQDSDRRSYIDLNRSGTPLIEIVTEPDLRSPEEAYDFLTRLKTVMLYLEISDCNMEEGSLRCDANASVRPAGSTTLGTKTEVKNLNSFRFLQKALAYETKRQMDVIDSGGTIEQETRLWDNSEQRTYGMRSKEFAHDYRYFPEPDLLPLVITEGWKDAVRRELPELPDARQERLLHEYALPVPSAAQLTTSKELADYFEAVVTHDADARLAANWTLGELQSLLNESKKAIRESPVPPEQLAELLKLIAEERITGTIGKELLRQVFMTSRPVSEVMKERGFERIDDPEQLAATARQVIAANPKQATQYRNGKTEILGWFVGQVMKATRGQANPKQAQEILKTQLAGKP